MSKKGQKLRVGVIGVGRMGRHHLRVVSEYPEVQLAGLYDPDKATAKEYCEKFSCTGFESIEKLLKKSDAVIVAAPTTMHQEVGEKCLAAGVHVLMEKPLADFSDAGQHLVDLAEKKGKILMVGHIERYNPAIDQLIRLLREKPEKIVSIETRRYAPLDGARMLDVDVLADMLIHDVDIVMDIVDSPIVRIVGSGRPVFSLNLDAAQVFVGFDDLTTATLSVGRCVARKVRTIAVITPTRYLEADTLNGTLTVHSAGNMPKIKRGDYSMGEITTESIPLPNEEPLRRELEDFIGAIKEKRGPLVDGERGLAALKLIEVIGASIACGVELSMDMDEE